MLLKKGQIKHLKPDDNRRFVFVDDGNVTESEKQALLKLDADYYKVYQYHIITNLEELKK